eukprot:g44677.t1
MLSGPIAFAVSSIFTCVFILWSGLYWLKMRICNGRDLQMRAKVAHPFGLIAQMLERLCKFVRAEYAFVISCGWPSEVEEEEGISELRQALTGFNTELGCITECCGSPIVDVLLVATGMWVPNTPDFPGSEHVEGYESVSVDPADFVGQTVLILGRGNAAFETADNIVGVTNFIHMLSRSRLRLAWATHYVGDV